MKSIDVENDLYRYIASQTQSIGEDASAILRRLLGLPAKGEIVVDGPIKDPQEIKKHVIKQQSKQEQVAMATAVMVAKAQPSIDFSTLRQLGTIKEHKLAVGRFLFLLEQLHRITPDNFELVLTISGRDRKYFSKDEAALLNTNASTNPKQIGDTGYWVITNSNTSKKRSMLMKSLQLMGCDPELSEEISSQI